MGSSKSGRYRDGKMTAKQRKEAIRLITRKRKPLSVRDASLKYDVSTQYIYQLIAGPEYKSLK